MELLVDLAKILNESDRRRYTIAQQLQLAELLVMQQADVAAIIAGCEAMASQLLAGYAPDTADDFFTAELKMQLRMTRAEYVRYRIHLWYYEATLRHYQELCEAGFESSQAAIYTQARVYRFANQAQTSRRMAHRSGYFE